MGPSKGTATATLRLGFVEDHGVEAMAGEEACVFVELDCLVVGFGHG